MRKKFVTFILVICVSISYGQQMVDYGFNVKSKYNTAVKIGVVVRYGGEIEYSHNDSLIQKIHARVVSTLSEYNAIEMYSSARYAIQFKIDSIFRDSFHKRKLKFDQAIIRHVEIPEELKVLYEQQMEIQQKYLRIPLIITNKKDSLNSLLNADSSLSKKEIEDIETELKALDFNQYYYDLYNSQLLELILKKLD